MILLVTFLSQVAPLVLATRALAMVTTVAITNGKKSITKKMTSKPKRMIVWGQFLAILTFEQLFYMHNSSVKMC
jgi:hypothetical protein